MTMLTIEQLNANKQALLDQLKLIEETQKNFPKREEGFKKLAALDEEFAQKNIALDEEIAKKREALVAEKAKKTAEILKNHYIQESELQAIKKTNSNAVLQFDGWEWFVGRKGKVPFQVQEIRAKGFAEVSKYLTENGKKFIETAEGKQALDKWIAQGNK